MSMGQNQLTRDLYAAGYTWEDHPSFVYWSDWQNFGYLFEALLKFTWETPCGLLVDGKSDLGRGLACCDASFQGIDYCPENDNPLLRCPYERKDCPHSISGFPVPLCPCHTTGKRYSFEQSAEKVESERSERQHRQYMEITGGAYCACVVGGNGYDGGRVEVQYDVEQCIRCRCQNPVCVIRKQKRDLSRANIFYDVRRTWVTRIGFLEEKKVQVTKGERVFPHPVAQTDAEIWLEMKKAHFNPLWSSSVIDSPHLTPEDRRQTFFSKMHRRYGEYDYFEFHYDVENIRIAKSEQRDLLQDLRDVADGLEVVHAVDLKKEQAAKKRESRQRRKEQKERRLNKRLPGSTQGGTAYTTDRGGAFQQWRSNWLNRRMGPIFSCGSVWTAAASRKSTLTPQRKAGAMLPAQTAPRRCGCGSLRRFIRCIDLLSIHFRRGCRFSASSPYLHIRM